MTPEQNALVRGLFENVMPVAETVAALFYARLFELDPKLQRLFITNMQEQRRKVMDMLLWASRNLDHYAEIAPTFESLGRRHVYYGVKQEDYRTVEDALTWALEMTLGAAFTPEIRAAWLLAYNRLTTTMNEPAAEAALVSS